jgi:DNA helicase-2/ATP-dependent DNA helicase PcrA
MMDITFWEALERARNITSLGRATGKIESFVSQIRELREYAQTASLPDLLRHLVRKIEYEDYLRAGDDDDADDRIRNVDELISNITDYDETAEDPSLAGFLEEVALIADIDDVDGESDRVLLMTLHSAKGLEFPHVYITGLEEEIFPSGMAMNSDDRDAIEEERRLAYVGITRAKDDLTLLCARSRMLRGEMAYHPMSRFLTEIPDTVFEDGQAPGAQRGFDDWDDDLDDLPFADVVGSRGRYGTALQDPDIGTGRRRPKAIYRKPHTNEEKMPYIARASQGQKKASLSSLQKGMPAAPEKPAYEAGDRVEHVKYGTGTVQKIEAGPRDYKVTVQFDDFGRKIMYAAFAKLRKC